MLIDDRGHRSVVKLLREVFLKDRGLGDLGVGKLLAARLSVNCGRLPTLLHLAADNRQNICVGEFVLGPLHRLVDDGGLQHAQRCCAFLVAGLHGVFQINKNFIL